MLHVNDIIDVGRLGWDRGLPLLLKQDRELEANFRSNFHIRRNALPKSAGRRLVDNKLVVLVGEPRESRFFKKKPIALKKTQSVDLHGRTLTDAL